MSEICSPFLPSAVKLPCTLPVCPQKIDIHKVLGGKDCIGVSFLPTLVEVFYYLTLKSLK